MTYPVPPGQAPNPYPGYFQASDGQWYPVSAAPAPPPQLPPGYPPGYGQPQQAGPIQGTLAPPQPVLARGTLEDYLDQPTGGGGPATSKFFTPQRPQGSWLHVRVTRDLNNADVRQQTDKFGKPLTFPSSGKPKFVLIIPCQVLNSSDPASSQHEYSDGSITVWLKGVPSDSFKAAMAAAGVSDPAKALALGQLAGAEFFMISAGTKQFGTGNPANMFDFRYTPTGRELLETAEPVAPAAVPPTAPPAPALTPAVPAVVPPPPAPGVPPAPPAAVAPPAPPPAPPVPAAPPAPVADPYPGYYQASDGQWYPNPATQTAPVPPAVPTASVPPAAVPGAPLADPRKAALLQQLQGG